MRAWLTRNGRRAALKAHEPWRFNSSRPHHLPGNPAQYRSGLGYARSSRPPCSGRTSCASRLRSSRPPSRAGACRNVRSADDRFHQGPYYQDAGRYMALYAYVWTVTGARRGSPGMADGTPSKRDSLGGSIPLAATNKFLLTIKPVSSTLQPVLCNFWVDGCRLST